jgi:hypothetical protein
VLLCSCSAAASCAGRICLSGSAAGAGVAAHVRGVLMPMNATGAWAVCSSSAAADEDVCYSQGCCDAIIA